MSDKFLFDGPADARATILLAHGAGAPMDSASMTATAKVLAAAGLRIARFEFQYMASRRTDAGRKPPPRADTLNPEYKAAVAELGATGPLVIGGKSMGGRVATMIADELYAAKQIAGLLCLGYLSGAAFYAFQHDMVAGMFGQLGYPVYLTYLLPVVIGAGPCRNPVAVFCAA